MSSCPPCVKGGRGDWAAGSYERQSVPKCSSVSWDSESAPDSSLTPAHPQKRGWTRTAVQLRRRTSESCPFRPARPPAFQLPPGRPGEFLENRLSAHTAFQSEHPQFAFQAACPIFAFSSSYSFSFHSSDFWVDIEPLFSRIALFRCYMTKS